MVFLLEVHEWGKKPHHIRSIILLIKFMQIAERKKTLTHENEKGKIEIRLRSVGFFVFTRSEERGLHVAGRNASFL